MFEIVPEARLEAFKVVKPDPLPEIVPPEFTTRLDEIVTAKLAAPKVAALLIVTDELNVLTPDQLLLELNRAEVLMVAVALST